MISDIVIKGARVNNLKNISLTMPRDKFIVITGLSGSGKSSLAFDTLYAEGHRRFVESLSSYARQFLGQLDKPDVDYIEGLSPAISIDQKTTSRNPRSTVGTVTEIYDYLRLLYARIGVPHCPICGEVISSQSVDEIVADVMTLEEGTKFMVLAPVVTDKKGTHDKAFEDARKNGYVRVRVDDTVYDIDERPELDKNKKHTIEIVVDRLVMHGDEMRTRLTDSIETALKLAEGIVNVLVLCDSGEEIMTFSQNYACKTHGISIGELTPKMFSFNSPFGACEACGGLGESFVISPERIMPDKNLSLFNGGIMVNGFKSIEAGSYTGDMFNALGRYYGFDIHTPFKDYSDDRIEYTQPKKSIAPETHRERTSSKNNRLVEINTTARLEVAVMSPVVFNDAKEIAEFLSRKNPVVINLEKADRADTRRIVDFLSGVVYAIDGNIQKISNDIFLVTPYNVSVLGSFKEDLKKGVLPWETEEY